MHKALLALAVAFTGCHGPPPRAPEPGAHTHHTEPPDAPAAASEHAPVDPDVVAKAARPFGGVRVEDGELLSADQLFDQLAQYDVVCVGEDHANPPSQFAELAIVQALIERDAMNGRELGLGIEMLPRSKQPALERWQKGEIGDAEFLADSDWRGNWGYDFAYYRPVLDAARSAGSEIVALNVARDSSNKLARGGVSGLSPEEAAALPALDLSDREHRRWFEDQLRSHPTPHAGFENLYAAQVLWDETMAESVCRWVGDRLPGRQMVVLAGAGHCRAPAIPKRVARRCGARGVGVRPSEEGEGDDARADSDGFDYLFRMSQR